MEKICCIFVCECFNTKVKLSNGRFENKAFIRELACLQVSEGEIHSPKSYHFDLQKHPWHTFTQESQGTIRYQTKRIHGLQFYPYENEIVQDVDTLEATVQSFYENCVSGICKLAAFKGGNVEKDLLKKCNIPFVDLQAYGCPSFDKLKKDSKQNIYNPCDHHEVSKNNSFHCAQAKARAYRDWAVRQKE